MPDLVVESKEVSGQTDSFVETKPDGKSVSTLDEKSSDFLNTQVVTQESLDLEQRVSEDQPRTSRQGILGRLMKNVSLLVCIVYITQKYAKTCTFSKSE